MELPILQYLPLSDDARKIVLKFLWTPHPTAVLIKTLTFLRHDEQFTPYLQDMAYIPAGLRISGPELMFLNRPNLVEIIDAGPVSLFFSLAPPGPEPYNGPWVPAWGFCYDAQGEHIPILPIDDNSEEYSDSSEQSDS